MSSDVRENDGDEESGARGGGGEEEERRDDARDDEQSDQQRRRDATAVAAAVQEDDEDKVEEGSSAQQEESGSELESGIVEEEDSATETSRREIPPPPPSPVDPNRYFPKKCVMSFRLFGTIVVVAALALAWVQVRYQATYSGKATGVVAETPAYSSCSVKIEFEACSSDEMDGCSMYLFEGECQSCAEGESRTRCTIDDSDTIWPAGVEKGFVMDVLYNPDNPSDAKIASNVPKPWVERVLPTGVAGVLILLMTLPCAVRTMATWRERQIYAAEAAKEGSQSRNSSTGSGGFLGKI